jgi:hypothetical protein
MTTTLPASAIATLEEARLFAEHADALGELEEDGWRFGRSDSGVFVAERGTCRRFHSDLADLIRACTPRLKGPNDAS